MENSFGKTLSNLMRQKGLSAKALARDLALPYRTVQEWLGPGDRIPRNAAVIRKLAEFFDVSTHYLLFGQGDPHSLLGEILEKTEIHTGLYEITIKKVKSRGEKP